MAARRAAWLLGIWVAGCYSSIGIEEHGECRSSADCEGRVCLRIPDEPGGYWMCEAGPPPAETECSEWVPDACCDSSDCTAQPDGMCYRAPVSCCPDLCVMAAGCIYDECDSDADCAAGPHGICIPRNVRHTPRRTCSYGACRVSADCSAAPDGYCAPVDNACCAGYLGSFICEYPGGCRTDDDCGPGLQCLPDSEGRGRCSAGGCPI